MPIKVGNSRVPKGYVGSTEVGKGYKANDPIFAEDYVAPESPAAYNPAIWFNANDAVITRNGSSQITAVQNKGFEFSDFDVYPTTATSAFIFGSGNTKYGRFIGQSAGASEVINLFKYDSMTSYLKTFISIGKINYIVSGGGMWVWCPSNDTGTGVKHPHQEGVFNADIAVSGPGSGGSTDPQLKVDSYSNYVAGETPYTFFTATADNWEPAVEANIGGELVRDVRLSSRTNDFATPTRTGNNGASFNIGHSISFPFSEDVTDPSYNAEFSIAAFMAFDYVLTRTQIRSIFEYYKDLGYDLK